MIADDRKKQPSLKGLDGVEKQYYDEFSGVPGFLIFSAAPKTQLRPYQSSPGPHPACRPQELMSITGP